MNIFEQLSDILCVDANELMDFASTSPHRYKVYTIAKRNSNKRRLIAHPSKELKFIQRILIKILEPKLKVNNVAHAYIKDKSIKTNAMQHVNSKYLLKMDLENFFPSITPNLFFSCLTKSGVEITERDKELLTGFLFWKPRHSYKLLLSIGAPSSPLVSNFILNSLDEELSVYCESNKIKYTRYADDLTFSTNVKDILFSLPEVVSESLYNNYNGDIKVNKDKTIFSSKGFNRHVTGIVLTNDNVLSIGREKKRVISSTIHKLKLGALDDNEVNQLQGIFAHACFIEPDFYNRMLKKYGAETLNKIKK
ncbi:retron St85 family RNA-directed DNA polymerase [Aliivibrio fischeri]|uniref:retron St85 family RNA-directed DNA polymerase n=1 Tax=Aliivibrio fischeri TaxID=668 RepID=UPI00080E060A|nr:retron St85 family RNA-directed DNA polymerase [Aliivibrio fischeri]MUL09832.1 RNA-directed DNA polymerase [Aliivibrio fischeri]MUL15531.1 RNA-directed DNA polymerase [Aliivibrio fischeri]OCH05001.1 RNA-dependent DNA polymerase [Aliivibrio fischeri]